MSEIQEARLKAEQARALRLIANLESDFDAAVDASIAVATDDEHDPEGATIGYERAKADAMLAMTRMHLAELSLALARVRDGTYGTCQQCGRPIGDERLDAQPAATSCIVCASSRTPRLGR